jgi:uncharacterized protein (DUF427 family)
MADHITIRPAQGQWVICAGGAVLGESEAALELLEGSYPPVVYFPRSDIAMAFLEKSPTTSTCPHKGVASYYSIVAQNGPISDAVWSYETPLDGVAPIAGYLAFYPNKVQVEQV